MAFGLVSFEYPSFRRLPEFGFNQMPTNPWEVEMLRPGSPIRRPVRSSDDLVLRLLQRGCCPDQRHRCQKTNLKAAGGRSGEDDHIVGENKGLDFRVSVDVSQFKPEELTVRTTGNRIVIHGKHEEREDDLGFIQREFTRSFLLPDDVDPETVKSSLSADGFLSIHAPKKLALDSPSERVIPIDRAETEIPNEGQESQDQS